MHTGNKFTLGQVLLWTRRELFVFIVIASVPTLLYQVAGWYWLSIPWLPVASIGTAVAFLIGFKNNASYGRLWEARKIWGSIVNDSRTWSMMVRDFVISSAQQNGDNARSIHIQLVNRHIAWMNALRFQLRQRKTWENLEKPYAKEFQKNYPVPEWDISIDNLISPYLSESDLFYVLSKQNRATQLLSLQSKELKELRNREQIEAFPYVELEKLLKDFFNHQGRAERIKNFPYPRQYATFNTLFVWLFILLVPFGMMEEIHSKLGESFVWMTIPFSVLIAWVFHTMEKMGEASENPFEGSPNDIPMENITRTIEIDMREMLDDENVPAPTTPVNEILM